MAFRYEALEVWPLALEYVDACFVIADGLPQRVQFSMGDQLRRAATSIVANIAEGGNKATPRSERNFYDIARGSVAETVGLLALYQRRGYLSDDRYQRMYNRANVISAMLWGLIKANDDRIAETSTIYQVDDHSLGDILASSSPRLLVSSPHESSPPLPGLPDDAFSTTGGQITKREVRLLALAELALQPGQVLWDIGAGSGSVSIEAARAQPGAIIFAVEKRAEMYKHLRENLRRFPAPNIHSILGVAPEATLDWPDPQAVFIGGSGQKLAEIIPVVQQRLPLGGRLVINLATLENLHAIRTWLPDACVTQVQINRGVPILDMLRFEALNPIFMVIWRKRGDEK